MEMSGGYSVRLLITDARQLIRVEPRGDLSLDFRARITGNLIAPVRGDGVVAGAVSALEFSILGIPARRAAQRASRASTMA